MFKRKENPFLHSDSKTSDKKPTSKEVLDNYLSQGKKRVIVKRLLKRKNYEVDWKSTIYVYSEPIGLTVDEITKFAYKFIKDNGEVLWIPNEDIIDENVKYPSLGNYKIYYVD
jgi:hypothetical protein